MLKYLNLGGLKIPMYTLMLYIAITAYFIVYFQYAEKREKIDKATSNKLLFISILGIAMLGISAFVFNSIFHSIEEGKIVIGGITWLGGFIGCVPFTIYMIHKFVPKAKGNAIYYFSLIMPGLILAHGIGRIGCFFGGCCYGLPTDSIFGISFPPDTSPHSASNLYPGVNGWSVPVWPTQLFEAIFEILLFVILVLNRKKFKNINLEIYLFSYGVFRFILEFMRGDDRGTTGFYLSPAQFICILLIVSAVLLILFRQGKIFKKLNTKCKIWREEAAKIEQLTPIKTISKEVSVLNELFKLKEMGAITEKEYLQKKEEIMKRIH